MNVVDMDTLDPQKDSFVNKELTEYFSDMLFKVDINKSEGYLYFLFEHKSYPSKSISFQLLNYMIEIWKAKIENEKANELPIIIPLVIYHGKERWNINTTLGEMINGYKNLPKDVRKHIPNYEYLLYDISRYTDEEIIGEVINRIIITILRDVNTKGVNGIIESIFKAAECLGQIKDKNTGIEYFETLIRYIFSARADLTKKDINKIIYRIENTYPEGSEAIMTLAEKFREEGKEEGIIQGIEKGIEKGEAKALGKTAIKLLTKKFGTLPEELKIELSKLDSATLEVIIDDIFEYKNLEDIKKYIH
jgi:predicted transposase/invertase (TIGR01784 family)